MYGSFHVQGKVLFFKILEKSEPLLEACIYQL